MVEEQFRKVYERVMEAGVENLAMLLDNHPPEEFSLACHPLPDTLDSLGNSIKYCRDFGVDPTPYMKDFEKLLKPYKIHLGII